MTDPTPNGQTGELICPLATCFGCPDPGRCDALRRGDQPAPSQRDPELAAALNEQRRQSYNAETLRTRPAPSSPERPPVHTCGAINTPCEHPLCSPAPSTPVPEASGRPDPALLRAEADDLDYIARSAGWVGTDWSGEVDRAASTLRRIADHLDPAPSSSPAPEASGRPDPLHLPKARAVIEWWLADEFGSLDAAVEGVLWTGPEEPREQVEQVLDALRQVLKTQEFEDD